MAQSSSTNDTNISIEDMYEEFVSIYGKPKMTLFHFAHIVSSRDINLDIPVCKDKDDVVEDIDDTWIDKSRFELVYALCSNLQHYDHDRFRMRVGKGLYTMFLPGDVSDEQVSVIKDHIGYVNRAEQRT